MSFIRRYLPAILAGSTDYVLIGFDVDADKGDKLIISVTDNNDNYVTTLSGSGKNRAGNIVTFTYESVGVFTAELVAERLEGVTEIVYAGPVDLSTHDGHTEATDLTRIETQIERNVGTVPFGKPPPDFYDNAAELVSDPTNAEFDLSDVPDRYTILDWGATRSTGKLSENPASGEELIYIGTSVSGVADQSTTPSNLRRYFLRGAGQIDLYHEGISNAAQDTVKEVQFTGTDHQDDMRFLALGQRNLVYWRNIRHDTAGQGGSDLAGSVTSSEASTWGLTQGDPVLPPTIEELRFSRNELQTPPNQFANCTALAVLGLKRLAQLNNLDKRWGSGQLDGVVQGLYAERSTVNSPTVTLTERYVDTAVSPSVDDPVSSLSQDSLDRIVGVGSYTLDGLIDAGHTVTHDTLWEYAGVTIRLAENTGNPNDEIVISGDQTTIEYRDYDSANSTWVQKTATRFQSGNLFRLRNHPDAGELTIASDVTSTNANGDTVVPVQEDLTDNANGDVIGATYLDIYTN